MSVIVNKHFTFFLTGVFSFLEGDFIMNKFGEAEAGAGEDQPARKSR